MALFPLTSLVTFATCLVAFTNSVGQRGPLIVNCSKFDDEEFYIFYDKEQAVNSKVLFFCKDRDKTLHGSNIVSCLPNGTWSDDSPKCKSSPKCSKFDETDHFVLYDNGQFVDSVAVFFCKDKLKRLQGRSLLTCLSTGQWSDIPPKCKKRCFVPNVDNGKIGRYIWYESQRKFEELTANSEIEELEELYLRCELGYEPFGNLTTEEKVTCDDGEWESFPICKPAVCRDSPPMTLNANIAVVNRTHGGGVDYYCKQFYRKVRYGNVTCNFGTWKGVTPICKDVRCSVDVLSFPGLIKGNEKFYLPDDVFNVSCQHGFVLTKENNQLKCMDGTWQGHLPPCTEAPCNPEDLVKSQYIVPEDDKNVLHGGYLKVKCQKGYSPTGIETYCIRGRWIVRGNLCQERSCSLYRIQRGGFSERVQSKRLNWRLTYDRWFEYPRIYGSRSPGSKVYVSCDDGYKFQGKWYAEYEVKCSKGEWDPDPVCLPYGTPYKKETKVSLEKQEKSNIKTTLANRDISTTIEPIMMTTTAKSDAVHSENSDPTSNSSCSCIYRSVDENLVAFVGLEQLSYGSKVQNNSKIKFQCLPIDFSRLIGVPEINCENCRSWDSSEFPKCQAPQIGSMNCSKFDDRDLIIEYKKEDISKNITALFHCKDSDKILDGPNTATCLSNGQWSSSPPQCKSLSFVNCSTLDDTELFVLYDNERAVNRTAKFYCKDRFKTIDGHNILTCLPNGQWSGDIPKCKGSPKCPKFNDTHHFILYDNEQTVNSIAVFFCKDRRKSLQGTNLLTCLSNRQWSGIPPKCIVTCPRIEETEGVSIFYTNNLNEGSIAAFLCPLSRTLSGVVWTTCKANGEWSDPPPKCFLSSCSLGELFEILPENVTPDLERLTSDILPIGFSLRLVCNNSNMVLNTQSDLIDIAKCGDNGTWIIPNVQCIPMNKVFQDVKIPNL